MNVNTSAAPGAATTLQKTTGASTRVGATDDAGADGAGSATFLSMLQALFVPESKPERVLIAASGMSAKSAAVPGQDGSASGQDATVSGQVATLPGQDAAASDVGAEVAGHRADAATDANGVLEDADISAVAALVTPATVAGQRQADGTAVNPQQGMRHATRPRPAGSGADPMAVASGGGEAATRAAADTSTAWVDASTALASKSAAAAQSGGDILARQAASSARSDREADMSTALAAAGDANDADSETPLPRPLMAALTSASTAPVVSMFEAGLAGLRGATGGRVGERQHARHATSVADGGFVPWTEAMPTGTSQSASPVYAPGATTPVPQAALAQKVHYWVSRGVQSAELQLDAFGGGSVKVHIAVKGDEAVVEFRTDQPQARKLLLDAMPQLQALLAEEGLNLSGGFVGSSAQQRSGADAQSGRSPDAQPADGRATTVNGAASGEPARAASGAAVDLFV